MGRFYETSQPHFIDNKMYEAPAELMANVLMNKEKAVDETIGSAEAYLDKLKAEVLTQDMPDLQQRIKDYESKISGIVSNIQANPLEYSKYQGDITRLGRDISADWTTGAIGTMQKYKKQVTEEYAAIDKLSEKDGYDASYKAARKKQILDKYTGIGWNETSNSAGQSPSITGNYKGLVFDDGFAQHMKNSGYDVTKETNGGNGYTYTKQGSYEGVSKERVAQAYVDYIQSNSSLQEAVNERRDLGLPGFENADLSQLYEYTTGKDGKREFTGFRNDYYGNKINAGVSTYARGMTKESSTIGNDEGYWKNRDYQRADAKEARDKQVIEEDGVEVQFTRAMTTNTGSINSYLGALTSANTTLGNVKTQAVNIAKTLKINDPKILGQLENGNFQALVAAGVPAEKINKLSSDFRQSNAMKMVLNAQNTEFTNWAKKNKIKGADKIGKSGWSKDENLTKAYSKFTRASKIVKTVPQTLSFNGMGLSKDTKKQFQDVFLQNFDNVVFKMEGTAKGNQEVRETSEGKKIIYTGDKSLAGKAIANGHGKGHTFYVYVPEGKVSVSRMIQDKVLAKGNLEKDADGETGGLDYVYFSGGKKIGMQVDEKTLGLASGYSNKGTADLGATVTMGNNRMVATFDASQISSPTLRKVISERQPDYEFDNLYNKTNWETLAPITKPVNGHIYSIKKGEAYENGIPVGEGANKKAVFKLILGY